MLKPVLQVLVSLLVRNRLNQKVCYFHFFGVFPLASKGSIFSEVVSYLEKLYTFFMQSHTNNKGKWYLGSLPQDQIVCVCVCVGVCVCVCVCVCVNGVKGN